MPKKSLDAIAKHVGVTRGYVSQVKGEMEGAHGVSTNAIDRAEKIEVMRNSTAYEQKSQEKQHRSEIDRRTMTPSLR